MVEAIFFGKILTKEGRRFEFKMLNNESKGRVRQFGELAFCSFDIQQILSLSL